MQTEFRAGAVVVSFVRGDITREQTDAVVNAANRSLLGGGGVDGAIHAAAGPRLLAACRALRTSMPQGLDTGKAVLTPGFDLSARHVIHCVGPIYDASGDEAPELLGSCYREAIALAKSHGLRSVAFPSISTGIYGYPVDDAARVALSAVRDALAEPGGIEHVKFVLFDARTEAAYVDAAREVLA